MSPRFQDDRRRRYQVLVAEDDDAIRDSIVELLDFEGYCVVSAANGVEALAEIEREIPCVLLLDLRMPVLDGGGVARALRDRGIAVPIVALTAARDSIEWATEIGASALLAKPFDILDLLAVVERFCLPSVSVS